MTSVLFFLPTVLIICDKLIEKTTMKVHFYKEGEKNEQLLKTNKVKKASTFVLTTSILMSNVYPAFADTNTLKMRLYMLN